VVERKSFLLRISPELYGAVEKWAADELRSVNAQVEFLLLEAVRRAAREQRPRNGAARR
jgi:hypothetical protein